MRAFKFILLLMIGANLMAGEKIALSVKNSSGMQSEFSISLTDNSPASELVKQLKNSPLTLKMSDFSNFEKVGKLPFSLPRDDEPISTDAGDVILYQGSRFVIYYDQNSWNFTRLGVIDELRNGKISKAEFIKFLGNGDIEATLRVKE
ncbi:hypothetical protein CIG11343_1534 [Campylobacter iguaniorum]|uniref:cyclophilin-like fold protein n=1 Tax=Campylobacter iguaniorum TaxID=1244531 RepID=UPI0007C9D0D6|nr:cyclophilin-like fold protein [Campylobacter iguaniorum]ANE36521.1 hypothetical protein CIG11343_1534 [Campylobacter iguaniorum]